MAFTKLISCSGVLLIKLTPKDQHHRVIIVSSCS